MGGEHAIFLMVAGKGVAPTWAAGDNTARERTVIVSLSTVTVPVHRESDRAKLP
jgi:hypothetical protein